ncbi:MAG TPA: ACT domain-containing protein [Thermoanaerobaculia bacterium]|nr:ACT domain-containing protein [Thermoanaerobaculia bacterium]
MTASLKFSMVPGTYAVCRLPASAAVPAWAGKAFVSITRTAEELSIVCEERRLPEDVFGIEFQIERGWVLLKLHGPFPLDAIGVLSSVAKPLAEAAISLFALSTFDTDYILVKRIHAKQAIAALTLAGHTLVEPTSGAFRRS